MKIAIAVLMKMQWLLPEIGNSRIRLILKKKKKRSLLVQQIEYFGTHEKVLLPNIVSTVSVARRPVNMTRAGGGNQYEDQSENDSEVKGPLPPSINCECHMIDLI